jgi:mannose-6-phosphate isomerase-like protein (cupin superfamily)
MRLFHALPALLCLMLASGLSAQDRFGSITNEPRPEEYLHWNATAFGEIRRGLEQQIEEGSRIWNTRFVFTSILPGAAHRPHDISIVHREGYTQPEIHELKWDLYVILDGSGTLLVGGERVGWVAGLAAEEQRPELRGARAFQVTKGDIVHVPARVWHQVVLEPGAKMTYALINVNEPGGERVSN